MPDCLQVAVTVITQGKNALLVWNPSWGAFTLPMTKVRTLQLGLIHGVQRGETWEHAALRNVGECLGQTSTQEPRLLVDIDDLLQSDRTGAGNHYHFQVFWLPVEAAPVRTGPTGQWLPPTEIINEDRGPISPTARLIMSRLRAEAAQRGKRDFPPPPPSERRTSEASVAVFRREQKGQRQWLTQWNENWQRYHLVGGRRQGSEEAQQKRETAAECLERELKEKLGLKVEADYSYQPAQPPQLTYPDWSTATWEETDYRIWTFQAALTTAGQKKVDAQAGNRWVTRDEVLEGRCRIGKGRSVEKTVSATTRKILWALHEL
jgi:ADP-ribose pyrophosphatase YjhB (NUDIX family)